MWRAQEMQLTLSCHRYRSTTSLRDEHKKTVRSDLRIARRTADDNVQDFLCDGGSPGAWFATEEDEDAAHSVLKTANQLGYATAMEDDMEVCLEPYEGNTSYYTLKRELTLWDMSQEGTIVFIRRMLRHEPIDLKLFDTAFQIHPEYGIVRNSKIEHDVPLCQMLHRRGIFTIECPGWYHPTMLSFNAETNMIQSVRRREIVLIDPMIYIKKIKGSRTVGFGYPAPKKEKNRRRTWDEDEDSQPSLPPRPLIFD